MLHHEHAAKWCGDDSVARLYWPLEVRWKQRASVMPWCPPFPRHLFITNTVLLPKVLLQFAFHLEVSSRAFPPHVRRATNGMKTALL